MLLQSNQLLFVTYRQLNRRRESTQTKVNQTRKKQNIDRKQPSSQDPERNFSLRSSFAFMNLHPPFPCRKTSYTSIVFGNVAPLTRHPTKAAPAELATGKQSAKPVTSGTLDISASISSVVNTLLPRAGLPTAIRSSRSVVRVQMCSIHCEPRLGREWKSWRLVKEEDVDELRFEVR